MDGVSVSWAGLLRTHCAIGKVSISENECTTPASRHLAVILWKSEVGRRPLAGLDKPRPAVQTVAYRIRTVLLPFVGLEQQTRQMRFSICLPLLHPSSTYHYSGCLCLNALCLPLREAGRSTCHAITTKGAQSASLYTHGELSSFQVGKSKQTCCIT